MIKAILFDLFETLISEYSDGKRKAMRSSTVEEELLGVPQVMFKQEWGKRSTLRMEGHYARYHDVIREILELNGRPYIPDRVEALYQWRVADKRLAFTNLHPEIIVLLDRLKEKGMKLGLVSNCTDEEVEGWSDSPLCSYFDPVLFSFQARVAKPDLRIYQQACAILGMAPEETAFVGDGGSQELEGAKAAGLRTFQAVWYVPPAFRQPNPGCPVLESPRQLLEWF